ncbi:response regulator [Mastigocladopsis repens]|uniref:response regulator n=1 Tax=Mastigocladopsis repens TaxID=221287 RepID=UPI0002DB0198|nr:response regulator [Mastigocladopsis repens]
MPVLVGISVFILTLLFWQELLSQEDIHIRRNVELAVANVSHDITAQIQTRTKALDRMAKRWEVRGETPKREWEADALNYYQDFSSFQGIEWVDKSSYVRWIVPLVGNEVVQNLNLTFEERRRTALEKAKQSRKITMTRTLTLAQGGKGFLVVVPLFSNNDFDGFIVSIFRTQSLLDSILDKNLTQKYNIAIFDGSEQIYATHQEPLNSPIQTQWAHKTEITMGGVTWDVRVSPTTTLLAQERSPLPTVVLGGGLATSMLLAWGVYLNQKSRRYAQQVRAINQELAHEITERQQAEAALQKYAAEFEDLYDNAPCGYHSVDAEGIFIRINNTELNLLGYTRDEVIGKKKFSDLLTESSRATFQECFPIFKRRGWVNDLEFQILRKDGTIVPVLLSATAIKDAAGQYLMSRSTVFDISERKAAEVELSNLSSALESAVEGVSRMDEQGHYIYVNQAYASMMGYQPEEMVSLEWQLSIHPEDREKVMAAHQKMLNNGRAEVEARGVRQDGSVFDTQVVMVKAYDPQQNYIGHYCFMKDISDRREIERLKDEFVSVVSHELRTPLTSIRGSLGLVASGVLHTQPEKAQRMLEIAVNNSDRLIRLINDILDIERMDSGKVTMTKQTCDAASLMLQSADEMRSMADKAEVTLSVCPISAKLWADPDRIVQTFTNLLSNAVKFSTPGSTVWLSAEIIEEKGIRGVGGVGEENTLLSSSTPSTSPSSQCYILFQVRDQGRGIPADKIETIFGRFQQVDASDARKKGGTGLGLTICRSIVQHHGGRIWAESTFGEGSIFYILLPIQQEQEEPIAPPTESNSNYPLVLVCDDDSSVRTVMQTMLEQRGYRVTSVASGEEAIEVIEQLQPDVILLNLMMPGMHGWETLAVLKQQPHTKDIPVIILSGLMPDARVTPHPGVSDWIVKPPDEELLFQALERALAGEHSQSLKVLIVEDDLDLAQVLIAIFERYNIETYHARTGREALHLSQRLLPDLLVLDLGLPEVDGFAVVDWLRHHRRLCLVPMVVYCAQDLNHFDRERLKLGQTLFLTKGRVTPEEFEQRVMNLLNQIIPAKKGGNGSDSQTHSHN